MARGNTLRFLRGDDHLTSYGFKYCLNKFINLYNYSESKA